MKEAFDPYSDIDILQRMGFVVSLQGAADRHRFRFADTGETLHQHDMAEQLWSYIAKVVGHFLANFFYISHSYPGKFAKLLVGGRGHEKLFLGRHLEGLVRMATDSRAGRRAIE